MMREPGPHPVDDVDPIIEPVSGYTVNIPMSSQGYPGWWLVETEAVERIMAIRKRLGIEINDFPNDQPTITIPVTKAAGGRKREGR